jgi:hypothetical protein
MLGWAAKSGEIGEREGFKIARTTSGKRGGFDVEAPGK